MISIGPGKKEGPLLQILDQQMTTPMALQQVNGHQLFLVVVSFVSVDHYYLFIITLSVEVSYLM